MSLKPISVPGELIKQFLINIKVVYLPGLDFRMAFDYIPIQKGFKESRSLWGKRKGLQQK